MKASRGSRENTLCEELGFPSARIHLEAAQRFYCGRKGVVIAKGGSDCRGNCELLRMTLASLLHHTPIARNVMHVGGE